jgi:hypothetical protein
MLLPGPRQAGAVDDLPMQPLEHCRDPTMPLFGPMVVAFLVVSAMKVGSE